jgi:glycerate 2-kinase
LPSQRVETYWGLFDGGQTAVIEMAKANGIHLLEPAQRNPLLTTTLGTGQMIRHALDLGVSKIILALGGSVTNDAGSGMAQALGVRFLDAQGREVPVGGGHLQDIEQIDMQALDPRLQRVQVLIASDVTNLLCGAQGASHVFGPQKGASAEMVEQLDQNLSHFADVVETQLNLQKRNVAGAGAAGGLGFGLMAFTGAQLQSGAKWVIEQTQLVEKIKQADYVFTGEGSIDFQTKFGKTPWAVAQLAKQLNKPVIAFAGRVGEDVETLFDEGFSQIVSINERIALISAWQESGYFSEKERAALILIEEITLIAQQHFPDSAYQKATRILSDAEIAAIEWIAIVINTWNRIAISSQYAVNP